MESILGEAVTVMLPSQKQAIEEAARIRDEEILRKIRRQEEKDSLIATAIIIIALVAIPMGIVYSKWGDISQKIEANRAVKEAKKVISNGYAYVDLGLSVKWATCNVGASNPWDYGDNFAWGETVGYGESDPSNAHNKSYTGGSTVKTYYDWDTYKYCSRTTSATLTKYNYKSSYGSVVDNKYTLDLSDDAARANMGSPWRMPTVAEMQELVHNCYWEWTDNYNGKGVAGYIVYKVKSASDKWKKKYSGSTVTTVGSYSLMDVHIFLPAAGVRGGADLDLIDAGSVGNYWSSSLDDFNSPFDAYYLFLGSDDVDWSTLSDRCGGQSVRAVVE